MNTTSHHTDPENFSGSIQRASVWNFEKKDVSHCGQLESSADGNLVVQDGIIRLSNHAMTGISAYGLEEILDTCVASFFDTEYMAAVQSLCEHVLQSPDGPQQLEATLVCKNGRRARTQITAVPCTFEQKPACLLKIHQLSFITPPLEQPAGMKQNLSTGIV